MSILFVKWIGKVHISFMGSLHQYIYNADAEKNEVHGVPHGPWPPRPFLKRARLYKIFWHKSIDVIKIVLFYLFILLCNNSLYYCIYAMLFTLFMLVITRFILCQYAFEYVKYNSNEEVFCGYKAQYIEGKSR